MEMAASPEAKAMERAKALGLSAVQIEPFEYRVTCVAGECRRRHSLPFHTVTIGPVFDACDCEYQRHVFAGCCKHIGAAMLHPDFRRPESVATGRRSAGVSPLMDWS